MKGKILESKFEENHESSSLVQISIEDSLPAWVSSERTFKKYNYKSREIVQERIMNNFKLLC